MKEPRERFSVESDMFVVFVSGNRKISDIVQKRTSNKRSLILLKKSDLEELRELIGEVLEVMES